jgi:hypothetical protein
VPVPDPKMGIKLSSYSKSKTSSIFGIILADFRFFLRGQYTKVDINPAKRIEKSAQKNPKIDRSLDFEQVLIARLD